MRSATAGWLLVVGMTTMSFGAAPELPSPVGWPAPSAPPETPGPAYAPPIAPETAVAEDAPRLFEVTPDAGPDETFFAVGAGLTPELFVWGGSSASPEGQAWPAKVQFAKEDYLAATLPEQAPDGLFLVWVRGDKGWSRPLRLNAPQPWWCGPDLAAPGDTVRVFGRDLARRPDRTTALVYAAPRGKPGRWLEVVSAAKYAVSVRLPQDLAPGDYEVWVHAGHGGPFGWGGPVRLAVTSPRPAAGEAPGATAPGPAVDLQKLVDDAAKRGGSLVRLEKGVYPFRGTLRIPAGVTLAGAGRDATRLQLEFSLASRFGPTVAEAQWNQAPGAVHSVGDTMEYRANFPAAGEWTVWLRYATDMAPWKLPGVSGNMTLQLDDSPPVPLENLPNTGGFGAFKWSQSARVRVEAGEHRLRWRNVKGGGISLDAFVFSLAPDFQPSDASFPKSGPKVVVVQGEDVVRFVSREGRLPGGDRAAVWLAGDGAGLRDLTVSGNPQVNLGVAVRGPEALGWVKGCRVERVRIADIEGKQAENCGVRLWNAAYAVVRDNEIWSRCPLYFSGVRQGEFRGNRLVSRTVWGGNAEAAIQGRNEVIEECVVEDNRVASPPGAEAGGPTARRLIWVSTGRGSITHNWFSGNGVERPAAPGAASGAGPARFGGVAGTDQNVGEMILFEANHRTMYFGPLAGAEAQAVLLPKTLPPTPDERLGSMRNGRPPELHRELLAHDADGNETPFWPPDAWDDGPEPPIHEYYVSVFRGPGQGQTRRVVRREGERLLLDRPWREPPSAGSLVAVGTGFYQNLIVGNYVPDGMTGVQLWISCIENVVAGNSVARQRKPALFLYATGTTLASSMPRTWNRGIAPLFFNHAEGNRSEECSAGALVTSGDAAGLPIEFPRALGNVLRHNSFVRNRTEGVLLVSRKGDAAQGDTSPSVLGTLVEFNVVRDAPVAYRAGPGSDAAVFRRNHAYFWYPVNNASEPPVAFQVDTPKATVAIEQNDAEDKTGGGSAAIVRLKEAKK